MNIENYNGFIETPLTNKEFIKKKLINYIKIIRNKYKSNYINICGPKNCFKYVKHFYFVSHKIFGF